jgi:hypothetical protein
MSRNVLGVRWETACCCVALAALVPPSPSLLEIWIPGSSGAWANDRPGVLIDWRRDLWSPNSAATPLPASACIGIKVRVCGTGRPDDVGVCSKSRVRGVVAVAVAVCWVMLVQLLLMTGCRGGILVCQKFQARRNDRHEQQL